MPRIRGRRQGQEGVVLILTLFVLLITYALVTQLTLGTSVALQTSRNAATRTRMQAACRSAARQFLDTLAEDAGGAAGTAAGALAGAAGSGGALDGGLGDSAGLGAGDGGQGDGGEEEGADADSWEDAWAKPMRILMGDIEITAWAEDENAKFNLLTLVAEDEEFRLEAREICTRILDRLREERDDDLSYLDARRITEEIVEWLEAEDRDQDWPRPERFSNDEEEDRVLPFTLEELMLLEHVSPELYYDQVVDEDTLAPGLESVFTVWTSVDLAPPGSLEGESAGAGGASGAAGAPAGAGGAGGADGAGAGGAPQAETSGPSAQEGGEEGGPPPAGGLSGAAGGEPAVGIVLNLNTMPRPVLEGLMAPAELPRIVVQDILEYRNEVDEEALQEQEDQDQETRELEEALYGSADEEPHRFFRSLEDLDEIESFQTRVDQEARDRFLTWVDVKSDVFSVFLYARIPPQDWRPSYRYDEPPGPVLRLRAVVWRRQTEQGARLLYLVPWHEVPNTRWRVPDFQDELPPFVPPDYYFR